MRRVLVVGGGGYLGAVAVPLLLQKGYEVRVLDRLFFGREPLNGVMSRIDLVEEDMRSCSIDVMDGVEAVINLGGLSNDPTADFDPVANHEMNTVASIRIAEMAAEAGVERLIFASSASIYDQGTTDEESDVVMAEDAPVEPTAAYAASKLAAEHGIVPLANSSFTPVVFRQGTVFGFSPRMRYDLVVNTFVKDALSTGTLHLFMGGAMWRPLVEVQDVARAYLLALDAPAEVIRGKVFNLAAGNTRIAELALRVQAALASEGVTAALHADFQPKRVRNYRISSQRVREALGWVPTVTVEESVKRMVTQIRHWRMTDFSNPRYYNIAHLLQLEEAAAQVSKYGYVLRQPDYEEVPA